MTGSLPAAELLDVWEAGQGQSPVGRALALLATACPDRSTAQLAALPIGRRDAELLTLRERLFGSRVDGLATCASCGERLDVNFDTDDIRLPAPTNETSDTLGRISVQFGEYQIVCRLPTSADLASLQRLSDGETRLRLL